MILVTTVVPDSHDTGSTINAAKKERGARDGKTLRKVNLRDFAEQTKN